MYANHTATRTASAVALLALAAAPALAQKAAAGTASTAGFQSGPLYAGPHVPKVFTSPAQVAASAVAFQNSLSRGP